MKVREGFVLQELNEEPVVVAVGPASEIFNGMVKLNKTGAFLFELMQDGTSEDDLVNALMDKYEIDEKTARNDVITFANTLAKPGIIDL